MGREREREWEGASEGASERERERGSEGARERGRERGREGAREGGREMDLDERYTKASTQSLSQ